MTALCGGGTSSAKPEFAESLFIAPSALAAFLNNIPTAWAVPLAAYIGAVTYQLSTFCATDPPAVPDITALDVANLLNVYNPVLNVPAATKFQQMIGAYLWYQVCQCDSVSTPAPPAPLAEPTGMPSINPPEVAPPIGGGPCQTHQSLYAGGIQQNSPLFWNLITVAAGAHQVVIDTFTSRPSSGSDVTVTWTFREFAADGTTQLYQEQWTETASFPAVHRFRTINLHNGTARMQLGAMYVGATQVVQSAAYFDAYCFGNSPTANPPPVDLSAILNALDYLRGQIDLMQRQAVPFAYVSGATHGGLSGDGEFAVQGLIGVRVLVDETGHGAGAEAGDPDTLFDVGWINWGNPDGWKRREFIGSSPMVSLPTVAGQYTRIGYSLRPGAVVTITELVREP